MSDKYHLWIGLGCLGAILWKLLIKKLFSIGNEWSNWLTVPKWKASRQEQVAGSADEPQINMRIFNNTLTSPRSFPVRFPWQRFRNFSVKTDFHRENASSCRNAVQTYWRPLWGAAPPPEREQERRMRTEPARCAQTCRKQCSLWLNLVDSAKNN